MREIKFRAWDKQKKIWTNWKCYDNMFYFMDKYTGVWIRDDEFKRFVLLQYTGQNDKNGSEMYEGDITVATINKRLAVIRFGEYKDVFGNKRFGFYYQGEEWNFPFMPDNSNVLVIGNIHDNPELLKEE